MNYEEFKNVMAERIKEFLPDEFEGCNVTIQEIVKTNEVKDCMLIMPKNSKDIAIPNLYLDDLYSLLKEMGSITDVLHKTAELAVRYTGALDFDARLLVRQESIVANVVSVARNPKLLDTAPYKPFLDLAVVYRMVVSSNCEGMTTIFVNNTVLQGLGMSKEKLHEVAMKNTRASFEAEVFKLGDIMYIATNKTKMYGATAILLPEVLELLAEKINGDFYILPSSIHEIIAVPKAEMNPMCLLEMLCEGNQVITEDIEVLPDSIYLYKQGEKKLEIAASSLD